MRPVWQQQNEAEGISDTAGLSGLRAGARARIRSSAPKDVTPNEDEEAVMYAAIEDNEPLRGPR